LLADVRLQAVEQGQPLLEGAAALRAECPKAEADDVRTDRMGILVHQRATQQRPVAQLRSPEIATTGFAQVGGHFADANVQFEVVVAEQGQA